MEKPKIDLNAPAFGPGAQKIEETPAETVVEPEAPKPADAETVVPSEEESKVPYSRFKKFHDAAKEAEKEAAYWRQVAEERQQQRAEPQQQVDSPVEVPSYWRELYGEGEVSVKAWRVQQEANERVKQEAIEQAREAVRNERYEEAARTEENVEVLDSNFEQLSAYIGRDLTDAEQGALLDIVDDYTPKDQAGNYAGPLMPFEKAWEVYELKTQASKAPTVKSRNSVADLTANQSKGEVGITNPDANFNPLDWNAWRRRI